jgi:WD40 repeat protein
VRLESLYHSSKYLIFSSDGRSLLSAGMRGSKRDRLHAVIWDVRAGRVAHDFSQPTNSYRGLSFAVDATHFLWGHGVSDPTSDMPATLTDVVTRANLAILNSPGPIVAAAISPGGETLATTVKTHVYFWPLGVALGIHQPDAAWFAAQEVRRLDGRERDAPWILPAAGLTGAEERLDALAFTPDGRRLLTGSAAGTIRLWPTPERLHTDLSGNGPVWFDEPEAEFDWQLGQITTLAVSPDGLTAAAGCLDGRIVVWDLDS